MQTELRALDVLGERPALIAVSQVRRGLGEHALDPLLVLANLVVSRLFGVRVHAGSQDFQRQRNHTAQGFKVCSVAWHRFTVKGDFRLADHCDGWSVIGE